MPGSLRGLATVVFINMCLMCMGNLNLFIEQREVKKLLGLPAEMFYVREGVVNEYALKFVVPVPPHISELHFSWQSLSTKPMPYVIHAIVSPSKEALTTPRFNITQKGVIPWEVQTFQMVLQCNGSVTSQVDVVLVINITGMVPLGEKNITSLRFHRKKMCMKDKKVLHSDSVQIDSLVISSSTNVFYVAVGSACVLIVMILTVVGLYIRSKKSESNENEGNTGSVTCTAAVPTYFPVAPESSAGSSVHHHDDSSKDLHAPSLKKSAPRLQSLSSMYASDREVCSKSSLNCKILAAKVERDKVTLKQGFLEGTFGRVYHGVLQINEETEEEVMVKTVTESASETQVALLLQEGMMMYGLSHKHILSIYGVATEEGAAPYLIYPFSANGNFKKWLQKCKGSPEGLVHTLLTQEVVDLALQIIHGVQFLHHRKTLHRDLATRNCVISEKLQVKITDNALARDLFPNDYHCLGDNENRPVKWLAIESLVQKLFSPASDVWAFGTLLWELTTLAQQPYVEVDPFEMASYLRDGYRLAQPINCPDELFSVMAYCWAMAPEERPTFPQLQAHLQDFHRQLNSYV